MTVMPMYDYKCLECGNESLLALTLKEHEAIVKAIARNDVAAAEKAMHAHIHGSWERRRLPDHAPRPRGRKRGQKRQ